MSVSVFVLDRKHRPLMPCRPARARRLLKSVRINDVHYPKDMDVLEVRCMGRESYRRTRLIKCGFAAGDMVQTVVPSEKTAGTYRGRAAARASCSFNIQTPEGIIQGTGWRHCRPLSFNDGYGYARHRPAPHSFPRLKTEGS